MFFHLFLDKFLYITRAIKRLIVENRKFNLPTKSQQGLYIVIKISNVIIKLYHIYIIDM